MYREFACFHNVKARNIFFSDGKEYDDLLKKYGNTDIYLSIWKYKKPYGEEIQGPFCFDIDNETLQFALEDARKSIEIINKEFELEDQLEIYFSGAKGFHVVIPHAVTNFEWCTNLAYLQKKAAQDIYKQLEYKSLDLKIYENRRLFRIPNSINAKTGLYKIQLTEDEIYNLKLEQILELAKKERYLPKKEYQVSSIFVEKFEKFREWIERSEKQQKTKIRAISQTDFRLPPCLTDILENGVGVGERNNAIYTLARFLKHSNKDRETADKFIRENYCEAEGIGGVEIRNTVDSAFKGGKFSLGCSTNYLIKHRCSSDCFLITKEIRCEKDNANLDSLTKWYEKCSNRKGMLGYDTGWNKLTKKIDGWQPGKFYVLTADTNIGKTDALCNISINLLKRNEKARVLFITLDDDAETIFTRLMSIDSGLTKNEIQNPNEYLLHKDTTIENLARKDNSYLKVLKYMEEKRLRVLTIEDVENTEDIEPRLKDANVIIVDGFHNITPSKGIKNTQRDIVSYATKELKRIIKRNNIVGIITAEARKSQDSKSTFVGLNDLAETRSLKYEPDFIMTMNNKLEGVYERNMELCFYIAKNKTSGFKGNLYFDLNRYSGRLTEV